MNKIKTVFIDFKWFTINFYNKIQHDKKLHLIAGALITLITLLITQSLFLSLLAGVVAGISKEYFDSKTKYGTVDFNDLTATITGSVIVILLLLLMLGV